jgi:hypothetical protein
MLIDVHAHFHTERSSRADGAAVNASRLRAGALIGVTTHIASILGTWGRRSPTYFPSPDDLVHANDGMVDLAARHPGLVRGYVAVNPNFTEHALGEIRRGAADGLIGVKLAASRRANDALLDPVAALAGELGLPVLHHIWQHRRREWPGQEASDAVELGELADRHPGTTFILAHIAGGGDWLHSLHAVRHRPNIMVDLSGSGVDGGMLDLCIERVGTERLLWGADLTLCTGWAKLRHLESLLSPADVELIRCHNAVRIFPPGSFVPAD